MSAIRRCKLKYLIGHGEVVGYFLVVLLGHLVLPTLASQHNLSAPMVCRGWNLQDRNTMGQEYTQAVRKCSSFFLPNKEKIRVQFFKYSTKMFLVLL